MASQSWDIPSILVLGFLSFSWDTQPQGHSSLGDKSLSAWGMRVGAR